MTHAAGACDDRRMLRIEPVPILGDNYAWLLRPPDQDAVAVIDPGDDRPVLEVLERDRLRLEAVLLTHHHRDHVGGLGGLLRKRRVPVFGPEAERIAGVDRPVADADAVELFGGAVVLEVLHLPGHTLGHVGYVGHGVALVGDTLFAGGCGRVFEGTPRQMHASLGRLAALDGDTAVYCAHEYTVSNLEFATRVEPANRTLRERLAAARSARGEGRPTVPSSIAQELATNPFLRCDEPSVVAAAGRFAGREVAPGADTFAVVRGWKDRS